MVAKRYTTLSSVIFVVLLVLLMYFVSKSGCFQRAVAETGADHYAERTDPQSFLKMPFNALVNSGYVVVGLFWLSHASQFKLYLDFCTCFASLAVLYGPIQFLRIVTQERHFALLDQWVTLPFFALAACWGFTVRFQLRRSVVAMLMLISVLSYIAHELFMYGFEIVLALHIAFAVSGAALLLHQCGYNQFATRSFLLALLSCSGFVVLKLLDHTLVAYWPFHMLTGHFWSKICDFMQIHYVLQFFKQIATTDKASKIS